MYRSLGIIHVKCYVRMYLVLVHVYLSFRCIFLICSCHLNNHPSILWTILYPSPDDGYYNRNVNVDFTSWYIHLFGWYFFLLPSYCRILSIFTFIYYIYMIREQKSTKLNSSKYCNISVICLHTVKWSNFSISNNSINCNSKLNGSKYRYVSATIELNSFMHSWII